MGALADLCTPAHRETCGAGSRGLPWTVGVLPAEGAIQ